MKIKLFQEILSSVYHSIKDPNKWCQGSYGLTTKGVSLSPNEVIYEKNIQAMCITGAICRRKKEYYREAHQIEVILNDVAKNLGYQNLEHFNDESDHTVVLNFLLSIQNYLKDHHVVSFLTFNEYVTHLTQVLGVYRCTN